MQQQFNRALNSLASRLGSRALSVADADRLAASTDLWPRSLIRLHHGRPVELPAAVLWPESVEHLQIIVDHARRFGFSIVPYGAGSSVVGGAMAQADQVVVDFKRMRALKGIDTEARTATAQTGIIGELFERQLERRGFTQGHFPSSIYCSTLGGWIAARSAGQMSSRYGKIEDQLLGGVIVLGDGSVVTQSPSPVRATLFEELVGSEGVLGLWAEATVRIHPLPQSRAWRAFDFPSLDEALEAAREWMASGVVPSVVRIYDPLDSFLHRGTHKSREPSDRGPNRLAGFAAQFPRITSFVGDRLAGACRCVLGLEGTDRTVSEELGTVLCIAERCRAHDLGAGPAADWYAHRYAVSYGQSNAFRAGAAVDTMEVACPWDRIVPTYRAVRRAALRAGAQVLAHFSHMYVDGGSIYFTYAFPVSGGEAAYDRLWEACLSAAVSSGANISHHHGTGRLKSRALGRFLGSAARVVTDLRSHFDPDRVFNPQALAFASTDAQESVDANKDIVVTPERHEPVLPMITVGPHQRLSEVETRARRQGCTVGHAVSLFADFTVLDLAKRRWLLRVNPQLSVIESAVAGVDGELGGVRYSFTAAPRSAQGPDLSQKLLEATVERVWLRCEPKDREYLQVAGEASRCLATAQKLVSLAECGTSLFGVYHRDQAAGLVVGLPRHPGRRRLMRQALRDLVGQDKIESTPDGPPYEPLGSDPLFFAGSFASIHRLVEQAMSLGVCFVVPWIDPHSAAGFFYGDGAGKTTRDKLLACIREFRAEPMTVVRAPFAQPAEADTELPLRVDLTDTPSNKPLSAGLVLDGAEGALENCTYCPKLCRFSCSVAVADGTETLLPRQLMLTADLARTGSRRLTVDTAARLWACVDCRGCKSYCGHGNDVASVLRAARRELYTAGSAPKNIATYLEHLAEAGRPPDVAFKTHRASLLVDDDAGAATGLFLGCQGTTDDKNAAAGALALARQHFGAVRVIRGPVACCGHPLWRWGARDAFARHARRFAQQLAGFAQVVVDDPGCAYALRELYPDVGVALPRVLTTASLIVRETWTLPDAGRYAAHDDPYSTRWLEEPGLRELLGGNVLASGSVLEGTAGCCGGMLLPVYDPVLAQRTAELARDDLLGGGAERIVVASPSCGRRLRAATTEVDEVLGLWYQHSHRCS